MALENQKEKVPDEKKLGEKKPFFCSFFAGHHIDYELSKNLEEKIPENTIDQPPLSQKSR